MGFDRLEAVDRLEDVVDTVANDRMPVPVREVWAFGDVALGLDPVDRLDIYLTKDVLLRDDSPSPTDTGASNSDEPDPEARFRDSHGIAGVGKSVRADWADAHPEFLRANANGHAAPEKCLAAHLLGDDDEPIHLEVCNASSRTTSPSACAARNCGKTTRNCSTHAASVSGRMVSEATTPSENSGRANSPCQHSRVPSRCWDWTRKTRRRRHRNYTPGASNRKV